MNTPTQAMVFEAVVVFRHDYEEDCKKMAHPSRQYQRYLKNLRMIIRQWEDCLDDEHRASYELWLSEHGYTKKLA